MSQALREIARLEGEITRIQHELDELRRSLGAPSSRRTQRLPGLQPDDATSLPPPQPSVPVTSETLRKSDRVRGSARTGLSDYPPPSVTPSRRHAASEPGAGRYEFVGEGRSRKR